MVWLLRLPVFKTFSVASEFRGTALVGSHVDFISLAWDLLGSLNLRMGVSVVLQQCSTKELSVMMEMLSIGPVPCGSLLPRKAQENLKCG